MMMPQTGIPFQLTAQAHYDVIVVGAGLAGLTAAVHAADYGSHVALVCATHPFSGSSFYPGTWGMGLVGPKDSADAEDLCNAISTVGCGVADPRLVRALVTGIVPAIEDMIGHGAEVMTATAQQREYIACFDDTQRAWWGLRAETLRTYFEKRLDTASIDIIENAQVVALPRIRERVCGVVTCDGRSRNLKYLSASAVVLATGGYAGLFRNAMTTPDVTGCGIALALSAGAHVVNLEFMQMMPGFFHPATGTVFNEKTFRFAHFTPHGTAKPFEDEAGRALLEQRSGYGPFTGMRASRQIDFAIEKQHDTGMTVAYDDDLRHNTPEFVRTYFDWLREAKGIGMDDSITVGMFAHAANGGIAINPDASTGVAGLYAAGEVTGGMHGADRIGGLASANALVFGGVAGRSAAHSAASADTVSRISGVLPTASASKENSELMKRTLTDHAMVIRSGAGLQCARETLEGLRRAPCRNPKVQDAVFRLQIDTASAVVRSMAQRQESRGGHFRSDFPVPDERFAHPRYFNASS